MSDGGKGSAPRPFTNYNEYLDNWDKIFMPKKISPCKHICKLNAEQTLCSVCYRNLDEISNWMYYSDEQKQEVMKTLDNRKNNEANKRVSDHQ